MLKTLAWKEIRELAPLIVMAALAQAFFVTQAMHRGQPFNLPPFLRTDQESIPFLIGDNSLQFIYLVAGAAAIVAGLWQTLGEAWRGTFLFLLHRPLTREAVVGVKLLVGGLAALLLVVAPVFFYAIWAALPGTHDSPFEWSYTRDAWVMCAELPVIYCGAFLSGLRPGNWFGSRFFPLAAALVTFGECQTIGNLWRDSGWAVGLAVSLAATVIFGWLIFHVARERDFS